MSGIHPPSQIILAETSYEDFLLWLEAFRDYLFLTNKKADDMYKKSLFLAVGGLDLRKIVNGLKLENDDFETLITALKKFIQPVKNILLERHKFFESKRESNEDLSTFLVRLRRLASTCAFEDDTVDTIPNQLVRDQFVRGIGNSKLTEHIFSFGSLTLEETVQKAEALHQATADTNTLAQNNRPIMAFNNIPFCHKCKRKGHYEKECQDKKPLKCFTCNKIGHVSRDCYKNAKCTQCHKVGHTANFCRRNKINHILSIPNSVNNLKYCTAKFFGHDLNLLVDTGASFSVISENFIRENNLFDKLSDCHQSGVVADGRTVTIDKCLNGDLVSNNFSFPVCMYVFDTKLEGIIGMDLIPKIGLRIGNHERLLFSVDLPIVTKNADIFDRSLTQSCLKGIEPFEIIRLNDNAEPKQCVPRNLSKKDICFVRPKIDELLKTGVIVESFSAWRHNVVVVPKSDGTPRLTINYKPLNSCTNFDAFPFPKVESLLAKLSKAKVMSTLDFNQCYHQLPLVGSDQEKTAFCFEGKLYQYTRCPFGLKNAVAYCSRIMSKVFEGFDNVIVYLDDVVVFSESEAEHDEILKQVFNRIRDVGLSLNKRKCVFRQNKISFLGYTIENGTMRPDESRFEPIQSFPLPTCVRSLQRFIGMMTYYAKYVPNFSEKIKLLQDKVSDFNEWTSDEIDQFEWLKKSLVSACLVIPSDEEELHLRTDASDVCVGAVLETRDRRPVFFCSRTLNKTEKAYDIVEKEALAIFWSILRLRTFLLGRKFVVHTDHKPLEFIFKNEKVSPKVLRWRMQLQEFEFNVMYTSGKSNVVADCLSRINVLECMSGELLIGEDDVASAQKYDKETISMIKFIHADDTQRPGCLSEPLWRVRNELLVKGGLLMTKSNKIFVPFKIRHKVLTVAHGAHHGIERTICRIRSKFFWPNLKLSVTNFVKSCRTCSLVKPNFVAPHSSPMLCKSPLEVLACDFIGPLPDSFGYKYCLMIIDVFSRYPFVFPLRDMKVVSIIRCFKQVFAQVGFPNAVLSDQGANFESAEFKNFLQSFQIKKLRTNAYHPSGNGICERFNGVFKKMMLSYVTERSLNNYEWVKSIEHCLLEYRTTPHSSTKARPVDLLFAFRVRGYLPFSSVSQSFKRNAVCNDLEAKERIKERIDRQGRDRCFEVNSKVLVNYPMSSKFDLKGKCAIVIKQLDSHNVIIQDTASPFRTFRCSTSRLSPVASELTSVDENYEDNDEGNSESLLLPRRSSRIRCPPLRLTYDHS